MLLIMGSEGENDRVRDRQRERAREMERYDGTENGKEEGGRECVSTLKAAHAPDDGLRNPQNLKEKYVH